MNELVRALSQATEMVVLVDATSHLVAWANDAALSLGVEVGAPCTESPFFEEFCTDHEGFLQEVCAGARRHGEAKHGTGPLWEVRATPIRDGTTVTHILILGHELDRSHSMAELEFIATHDDVTGLPNRKLFRDRLGQAVARARRYGECVGVLFMDLDGFKHINDSLGHDLGDLLLRKVGTRLAECVRESDTVARLGGDEFTVVLPAIGGTGDAEKVARKLLDAVSAPFEVQGHTLHITTSIGVATYPRDAQDRTTLVRRADFAMYRAKWEGRGAVRTYDATMAHDNRQLLALRRDLQKAIDDGELHLHWQPVFDVERDAIVAVEALLRWVHPEHGAVPPARVLAALDEMNREVGVTWDLLDQALREAFTWPDSVRLVVNLGPAAALQADLADRITHLLASTRLPAARLELDLTGSQVLAQPPVRARIARLREAGVRISIDDFGTNSLPMRDLREIQVDSLKLEAAFVREIGTPRETLVTTLIKLGQSMGVDVVAKGVEDERQCAFLRAQGCHLMQGWLFSHPVPREQLVDLLGHRG